MCSSVSLLREEHRLSVFENDVLRRILRRTRGGVREAWRSFIICSLCQILLGYWNQRKMKRVWHVARMGEVINAHKIVVEETKWKRPFGRNLHWWKDNIKINLKEKLWARGLLIYEVRPLHEAGNNSPIVIIFVTKVQVNIIIIIILGIVHRLRFFQTRLGIWIYFHYQVKREWEVPYSVVPFTVS
jgi:hypothetical protein